MNSCTFYGHLGMDAELRTSQSGKVSSSFSIAVRGWAKDEPPLWLQCVMFGKRAEAVSPHLEKGKAVVVSGRVALDEWTDRDGHKRTTLKLFVQELTLAGGKGDGPKNKQPKPEPGQEDDLPF